MSNNLSGRTARFTAGHVRSIAGIRSTICQWEKVIEGAAPKPTFLAIGTGHPFVGEILVVMDQTVLMTAVEIDAGVGNCQESTSTTLIPSPPLSWLWERLASAVFAELASRSLVGW